MPKETKEVFAFLKGRKDLAECCRTGRKLTAEETGPKIYKARCGVCGRGHIMMSCEPWELGLTRHDQKLAQRRHVQGDGGPPPGRVIILPNEVKSD